MNTIEAIYESGVFKPLTAPGLYEGQSVRLVIKVSERDSADEILELAGQVYEGLSYEDVDEIEKMALNRKGFFREKVL